GGSPSWMAAPWPLLAPPRPPESRDDTLDRGPAEGPGGRPGASATGADLPLDRECRPSRRNSAPTGPIASPDAGAVARPVRETLPVAPTTATMDRAWNGRGRVLPARPWIVEVPPVARRTGPLGRPACRAPHHSRFADSPLARSGVTAVQSTPSRVAEL